MTERIVVLGGGTGGTVLANKLASKLDTGDAAVTLVDETGVHVYKPVWLYVAFGDAEPADDEMVSSVAGTAGSLGELADKAAEPETIRGARTLLRALGDAGDPETTYRAVGVVGLLRALRDPEVKRGLAFLVALARGIGRELERGEE